MHLLITGAEGQLGRAFRSCFEENHRLTLWTRRDYDLADPEIADAVARLAPDAVLNAAAWTDVDGAEADPGGAFAANETGPRHLAQGAQACGALLVQISTNEVFAGDEDRVYRESDPPSPVSVYARSKAAGEAAVMATTERFLIARVAWLYAPGGSNFVSKIGAAADRHGMLRVVADEWGNPTYAPDVADAVAALLNRGGSGIYHLVNEGAASRFEWAQAILALSGREHVEITPVAADEWPRPAPPPRHAVLANRRAAAAGIRLRPWREALVEYFQGVKDRA